MLYPYKMWTANVDFQVETFLFVLSLCTALTYETHKLKFRHLQVRLVCVISGNCSLNSLCYSRPISLIAF